MSDFNVRRGLSTTLFSAKDIINEKVVLEEGYWYLCTDTAELFLCVNDGGTLTLKQINENTNSEIVVPTKLSELINDCNFLTEIPENYVVEEDIAGFALKADLTDLVSKTYVDEKVASIKIPEVPSKVSDLANDAGYLTSVPDDFATKEFVTSEITKAELAGQDVDLSAYYTKSETDAVIVAATSQKADKSELFSKDYDDLLNKPNIPSIEGLASTEYVDNKVATIKVPVKVSELENDTKFITENTLVDYAKKSDIPSDYITESELIEELGKIEHPTINLDNYVTKDEIKDFITEVPSEYVTESELDAKGYLTTADLSGKADEDHNHDAVYETKGAAEQIKNELLNGAGEAYDTLKELSDLINNNQGAIEALETVAASKADKEHIHDEYVTDAELDAKGYLTEHQSLTDYATKTYVEQAVKDIEIPDVNLEPYALKSEIPVVPTDISAFNNDTGYLTSIPSEYVTETELSNKGYITDTSDKADLDHTHTISDITDYVVPEIPSLDGYATEEYVDDAIANIVKPESADLSNYYTKTEVDAAIADVEVDLSGYATKSEIPDVSEFIKEIPSEYVTEAELTNKGFLVQSDLSEYARKTELPVVPSKLSEFTNDAGYITTVPDEYVTDSELAAKGYLTEHQDISGKADVNHTHALEDITDYVAPEIPSLDGYATEAYVGSLISTKANNILFTEDKIVTNAIGSFVVGESVKGLSITEILAKLLGLSDGPNEPTDPDTPTEPESIVENIIVNKLPMYSVDENGNLSEVSYKYFDLTDESATVEPYESGFYQIKDTDGNVLESGYQEIQINSDEVYYVIALPININYNTMVSVKVWDSLENCWKALGASKPALTNDAEIVTACCDEAGIDISHIDTTKYTVWALEDMPTGKKYRFVINE